MPSDRWYLSSVGFGFVDGSGHGEDAVDFGHAEEFEDTGCSPGYDSLDALVGAADVMGYDHTETDGVHIRHFAKVEDVELRHLLFRC